MHVKYRLKAYGKSNRIFNVFAFFCLLFFASVSASSAAGDKKKILAIGDSLTAGYGLAQQDAFPVQLEAALQSKGVKVTVENAGVSGDTSTGGLHRLDWALANGADYIILELGANDALRGIEPAITRKNLDQIIINIKAKNIPIFFTGMKAPPNMGPDYQAEYDTIFPTLAQKHDVTLYPFFLEGVASVPALNQDDAIHPNKEGVAIIVDNMLPSLLKFLTLN